MMPIEDVSRKTFPVVTVTLTPAVDLSFRVDTMVPGTLHRVKDSRQDPGGKGINVAKVLHGLGVPVLASGLAGGSRGAWIQAQLIAQGIACDFLPCDGETRINVKITDAEGRLTEFNTEALASSAEELSRLGDRCLDRVDPGGWVALCGQLPPGTPSDWYAEMIEEARRRGIHTVLDTSQAALAAGIRARPDIVKPNLMELQNWSGRLLDSEAAIRRAARAMVEDAGVLSVVVSRGPDGLLAVGRDATYRVRVPTVPVQSSVGAGDAVVAGLLSGHYWRWSWTDTLRWAAALGTAAVMQAGTRVPPLNQIQSLLSSITVHREEDAG
ncbi:MAG: 1-phosphofructokinase [Sulfobacillus sp.]|nr:1-phosphofructokinase [Sulfobacillus sp.]